MILSSSAILLVDLVGFVCSWIPNSSPTISSKFKLPTSRLHAGDDPYSENRGDARGASLLLEDVSVYRGPVEIMTGIDWRIEPRQKWALVGYVVIWTVRK
jgi:hypothetical protein